MDAPGFKELTKAQLSNMGMPEQLQYQRKLNTWRAEQKAKNGGGEAAGGGGGGGRGPKKDAWGPTDDGGFTEAAPADLARMGMGDQIKY